MGDIKIAGVYYNEAIPKYNSDTCISQREKNDSGSVVLDILIRSLAVCIMIIVGYFVCKDRENWNVLLIIFCCPCIIAITLCKSDKGPKLTPEQSEELKKAFEEKHADSEGMLTKEDLIPLLQALGEDITEELIEEFMKSAEEDEETQKITFEDFLKAISPAQQEDGEKPEGEEGSDKKTSEKGEEVKDSEKPLERDQDG
jgi:Ca2+-binding EF-hand superfamily protein